MPCRFRRARRSAGWGRSKPNLGHETHRWCSHRKVQKWVLDGTWMVWALGTAAFGEVECLVILVILVSHHNHHIIDV